MATNNLASFNTINDLLALRQQRKQAGLDRLSSGLSQFADQRFRGKQGEAERQARMAEIGARGEQDRATDAAPYQPFEDGPRTIIDPATGEEITLNSPADYALAGQMFGGIRQERDIEAGAEAAALDWANRFKAMSIEQKNAIERMERELEINREVYENGSYQTQDGAAFTWNTPEEYQAALSEIQEHTRKLSGLARDNPTAWEVYVAATDRAKEQMWEPYYDDEGMVRWRRTDVTQESLLENFVAELPMTGMSEDQITDAIEAFRTYLINAENAPPQDFSEGGDQNDITITTTVTPAPGETAQERDIERGLYPDTTQGRLVRGTQNAFGGSVEPVLGAGALALFDYSADSIPEGIDKRRNNRQEKPVEQNLYEQLVALAATPGLQAQAQAHIETLIEEDREDYPGIRQFIANALRSQAMENR